MLDFLKSTKNTKHLLILKPFRFLSENAVSIIFGFLSDSNWVVHAKHIEQIKTFFALNSRVFREERKEQLKLLFLNQNTLQKAWISFVKLINFGKRIVCEEWSCIGVNFLLFYCVKFTLYHLVGFLEIDLDILYQILWA